MKGFRNKKLIILGMVFFTMLSALTVEAKNYDLEQGKRNFFKAREDYYNDKTDISEVIERIEESISYIERVDDKYKRNLWKSKAKFLLGEIYEMKEEKRSAAKAFENSCDLALKALKINDNSSEAHQVLADNYMRLINYRGTIYMITSGPKSLKLLQKAIKLDQKNYTAFNALGIYYINAPKIGGGNVKKGIKMLNEALKSESKYDNFISHIWLAKSFVKLKEKQDATYNIKQALSIYPNSKWAQIILEEVQKM